MKIIVINKSIIEKRPPVLSVLNILADLKYDTISICTGATSQSKQKLEDKGIHLHTINCYQGHNMVKKIWSYLKFRRDTFKIIEEYAKNDEVLLWIEGAQTIVSLGTKIKKYKFFLQISELHQKSKLQLRAINKVIHDAQTVFMPEYNRTVIYQIWFKLKNRPVVLPNKPYVFPSDREIEMIKGKYKDVINELEGKKVILYQGGISRTRMLDKLALAIKEIGGNFKLLIVGPEQEKGIIDSLKKIDKTILHIPFIPAPDYLVFSTKAYIGYVFYQSSSLNNVFCAPNKINEFSAYSLPMLGNDIPGLKFLFEITHCGVTVNENQIEDIANGIKEIDNNYDYYKKNAHNLFDYYDNTKIIKTELEKLHL